jgi:hypothetical protein
MGVLDPNNNILTTATARNKKVAEQEASRLALEQLEPSLNDAFNNGKASSPVITTKMETEKKISPKASPMLGPATIPIESSEKKIVRRRPKIKTEEM